MYRIAIVEDQSGDAGKLKALLEKYAASTGLDFAITWFQNASRLLDGYRHQYELIFMDIRMPGVDGMQAAHELREMDHTVALVFLTSLAQYAVESYEVEATDYILKPITAAALALKLPRILGKCSVVREDVVIRNGESSIKLKSNELRYVEIYDHHIQFDTVSGVLAGKPMDETYAEDYKKLLVGVIDRPALPIVFNVNVGHAMPRCIVPFGIDAVVDTEKQVIRFDDGSPDFIS